MQNRNEIAYPYKSTERAVGFAIRSVRRANVGQYYIVQEYAYAITVISTGLGSRSTEKRIVIIVITCSVVRKQRDNLLTKTIMLNYFLLRLTILKVYASVVNNIAQG